MKFITRPSITFDEILLPTGGFVSKNPKWNHFTIDNYQYQINEVIDNIVIENLELHGLVALSITDKIATCRCISAELKE